MEILTNERPRHPTSCDTCSVKDCPTRGLLDTQAECTLSPRRMTASTFVVFVIPLLGACLGAALGEKGTVVQLAAAGGGFLAGVGLAMFGMRIFHGK
ncbi:MAG: hypothetical protein Q4D98_03755 [Planctomycetia bacterium]|nr:hypothetical protein [Planctomycetia bacterium]